MHFFRQLETIADDAGLELLDRAGRGATALARSAGSANGSCSWPRPGSNCVIQPIRLMTNSAPPMTQNARLVAAPSARQRDGQRDHDRPRRRARHFDGVVIRRISCDIALQAPIK